MVGDSFTDGADGVGRYAEAIADLEKLQESSASEPVSLNNLADLLATAPDDTLRDSKRAVELASRALAKMRKHPWRVRQIPETLDTLATAYAETGDFEKAIAKQREAIELAPVEEKEELEAKLKRYEAGKPYRRPGPAKAYPG